jgi:hypothetical protein
MFNDELHSRTRPFHINPRHWSEWLQSGIAPEIIWDNIKSLAGETPYDYLCYSDQLERTNTGRLVSHFLRQYAHTSTLWLVVFWERPTQQLAAFFVGVLQTGSTPEQL